MNDPLLVRCLQRLGDLLGERERFLERKRAGDEALADGLLHDGSTTSGRAEHLLESVEWRRFRGGSAPPKNSLLARTGHAVLVCQKVLGQDFDRDAPREPYIFRPVDLSDPARPERREDLVKAETSAGGNPRGRTRSIREGLPRRPSVQRRRVSRAAPASGVEPRSVRVADRLHRPGNPVGSARSPDLVGRPRVAYARRRDVPRLPDPAPSLSLSSVRARFSAGRCSTTARTSPRRTVPFASMKSGRRPRTTAFPKCPPSSFCMAEGDR